MRIFTLLLAIAGITAITAMGVVLSVTSAQAQSPQAQDTKAQDTKVQNLIVQIF